MNEVEEILGLLNPWWKTRDISKDLAREKKRKVFEELKSLLDKRQIIILTGLRRIGKTTLLYQLIEELIKKESQKKIIYFNLDKKVSEIISILNSYKNLTGIDWEKEKIYVFLDEITKLKEWSSQIKLIYDAFPKIKFFISSSSSTRLEEEAIVNLGGRYFLKNIKPLSFKEYLEFKDKKEYLENPNLWASEIKLELQTYKLRSFPEIVNWEDELLIKDYLRTTIIDKIIRQDLVEKFRDINTDLLLKLVKIIYTEPGLLLNHDNLSRDLSISKKTLYMHIFYLEFSYLIRIIKNFRPNILSTSRKMQRVYPYWWNLAYCYTENEDKIMENLVASHTDLEYYWRKLDKEIDFLSVKGKEIIPIEIKNKTEIKNEDIKTMIYFLTKQNIKEGIIIYNGIEKQIQIEEKTIKLIPLWKWLLEK